MVVEVRQSQRFHGRATASDWFLHLCRSVADYVAAIVVRWPRRLAAALVPYTVGKTAVLSAGTGRLQQKSGTTILSRPPTLTATASTTWCFARRQEAAEQALRDPWYAAGDMAAAGRLAARRRF